MLYSIVSYLYVSCSGPIISVGKKERPSRGVCVWGGGVLVPLK